MEQDTQETTVENTEATQTENVSSETETPKSDGKPDGYYPVDPSTASPEEVQKRIDYLYRQVKDQDRSLREYRSIAQQQSSQIDDLMNGVGRVVDHLQTRSNADTEAQIMARMTAAFESGDTKAYLAEQEKLIDFKAEQKLAKSKPAPKQQPKQETNEEYESLSREDQRIVDSWQEETDANGNKLRPWSKTEDVNDPDPDFVKAQVIAARVFSKNPHRSVAENLAEVDRIMGVKKQSVTQAVMGGNLTTHSKGAKITLTPKQQEIAVKTRFGGPKAKSDAEHIEAFRKQLERVNTSKRSR